jgi:CheY-like chemotaxis protein
VTSRPRILVVEDDPDNLESIVDLLQDEGYDVLPARTAQEATERVAAERPNLMIVDYLLPDMTGTELAGKLRRQIVGPPIPIVFLTAAIDPIDAKDAPVMKKPIALPDLLAVLHQYCGPAPSS